MSSVSIWFWQRILTPHMAYLAAAMAARGHNVTYAAEQYLDDQRAALGWQVPDVPGVELRFTRSAVDARSLVAEAPKGTVHLTQGFRSNGTVASAQEAIRARRMRHFVIMETVDQRGPVGLLKPIIYAWHLHRWRNALDGVLAIGADTPGWLRGLAPKTLSIFPFAYFLKEPELCVVPAPDGPFRFLFVGALIPRKRVDLMLHCLGELSHLPFVVDIIGDGPLRQNLSKLADNVLPGRVRFRGVLPISAISQQMAAADCLILPSDHDGWGAVVSEALMVGTPVICSAACGSRDIVLGTNTGGVFPTCDATALRRLLADAIAAGKFVGSPREDLRSWAQCIGTVAGAAYLEELLLDGAVAPDEVALPPWASARRC